jgi:hypothetical protein
VVISPCHLLGLLADIWKLILAGLELPSTSAVPWCGSQPTG